MVGIIALLAVSTVAQAGGDGSAVRATVLEDDASHTVIKFQIGQFTTETLDIEGGKYSQIKLGHEPVFKSAGDPELPKACRSIIIPNDSGATVNLLNSKFYEISGVQVAPSKGVIYRTKDPADVPFQFGESYKTDAFFPAAAVALGSPYIMRDFRAVSVHAHPFQFNPATGILRVYTEMTVEVVYSGAGQVNILSTPRNGKINHAFNSIYKRHFLNYDGGLRYDPLDEQGEMVIICHDAWVSNMQPLIDHRIMSGVPTSIVAVSSIGNSYTAIKSYIQGIYNDAGRDLAFVLLVGDGAQVDSPTGHGGTTDPTYALLAGSDNYPEILVGRFSAESAADVDTQVERTVEYEQNSAITQDWFKKAVGVASSQGAGQGDDGEADNVHMDNIRADLLPYGYTTVDQIYDPSGTDTQVSNALNAGRGLVNYCGHGSTTSWSSTGFNNSDVNALVNDNMLPFICSVACVNGQFDGYTCFAEAWLRATHNGEPTGAVATYMSSINQSWAPPMAAQDEFVDRLVDESYVTVGAFFVAGSCQMMDEYGTDGDEMYDTWHIFGDPALRVLQTCWDAGTVDLDSAKYACSGTANVHINDCGLNLDSGAIDTVDVTIASDSEAGETITLTETGNDTAEFNGSIVLSDTDAVGVLLVAEGDTITVTYIDADDGAGNYNVTVTDTAVVDCQPPTISNVQAINVEPRNATITFDANELARGTISYGLSCGSVAGSAMGSFAMSPEVNLSGLDDNTTYYYTVEAEDEAGNSVLDDNGGSCFAFTTPEVPDYFTELFTSTPDVAGLSLIFIPDGGNDFYSGCVESITDLPTDPTGGTNLSLGDDAYGTVNLTGGAVVYLYGTAYSTVYPVSNGYMTFDHGETNYTESLDGHFGLAQISALWDDLNPSSGGSVSYKQLADRFVVTWNGVPEYNTSNDNTFQVEMFFNGTIKLNYLSVEVEDALIGLSEGTGLDPDFYMSDMSGMGPCGDHPPTAHSMSVSTATDVPMNLVLSATDDGMPDPPAAMTFIVASLPARGQLVDPGYGPILSVPHTLSDVTHMVEYTPVAGFAGADSFTFQADDGGTAPDGGMSNMGMVNIAVGGPDWEPVAHDGSASTAVNIPVEISLVGTDPNSDTLSYHLASLPSAGFLRDPNGGIIDSVPYELAAGGHVVVFQPPCGEALSGSFDFWVEDATASSNTASVFLTVTSSGPRLVYRWNMDTDPGWNTEGLWEWGVPTGDGTHDGDPVAGYTGSNVYGYNLEGDYENNLVEPYHLTTRAINAANLSFTELRFRRWLAVESSSYDQAALEISKDGVNWNSIWEHSGAAISETSWSLHIYDISAEADGESTVFIRWAMGPSDSSVSYPGWNIDDVEIWAVVPIMAADFDGNGAIDLTDFATLQDCMTGPRHNVSPECICIDLNGDDHVDILDFAIFQEEFNGSGSW